MKLFRSKNSTQSSTQLARLPQAPEDDSVPGPGVPEPSEPPEPSELPPSREAARWKSWKPWKLARLEAAPWRLEATALLTALLIALALSPQVLNFARRDDYERAIHPLAPGWQTLESLEGRLYDARFSSRGPLSPRSARSIAIVAIDQRSLSGLKEWPWPRAWHARLIRRLKKAEASAIVFDINFSGKQNPLPGGELSAGDTALVAASEEAGNVLFPAAFRPYSQDAGASQSVSQGAGKGAGQGAGQGKGAGQGGASKTTVNEITPPFDELDSTTPDIGFNWLPTNSSGETRRYAWRAQVSGAPVASLAALAVGLAQKKLDGEENKAFFQVLEANRWPDARGRMHSVPLWENKIGRDDRAWTTPIYFWGPAGTFDTYSYQDVLQRTDGEWSDANLKLKFGGRIVFVGGTAGALNDVFGSPRFDAGEGEASAPQIAGVEMHAGVAAQMLDGRYVHALGARGNLAWLFAMSAVGALWIAALRDRVSRLARVAQARWSKWHAPGRIHTVMWLGLYAIGGGLPLIAFWSLAQWEFSHRDLWMAEVYPLLGASLSSVSALLLFFGAEASERRKVYARLKSRCSPDVLDELLEHPEGAQLRPYYADISVLFSDLEGFTYYSKTHDAEEVVSALNEYMTRMVEVVRSHGGTVDKFIGDAVMALFGAPIARYDHASQALACAVAMQDACAAFRHDTGIPFFMRVGVHSGQAIVGEMGSQDFTSYTAIGDTVNLAARLEAKNKELDARIVCSDATYTLAPGLVEALPTAASIRGLDEEVSIWVVRGMSGNIAEANWNPLPLSAQGPARNPGPPPEPEEQLLALPIGAQDAELADREPAAKATATDN